MARSRPVVLIVEDDEATVTFYRYLLEMEGFEVEAAPDARTALEIASRVRPDVAIVDMGIPGADGGSFVEAVRAREETARLKVIMATGKREDDPAWEGVERRWDCYLTKPINPADLVGALNRLLGRPSKG